MCCQHEGFVQWMAVDAATAVVTAAACIANTNGEPLRGWVDRKTAGLANKKHQVHTSLQLLQPAQMACVLNGSSG
jgi:hypothetical protein